MSKPKAHIGTIRNINYINYKIVEFNIGLEDPEPFNFIPGQFINLKVDVDTYRSYSIVSTPFKHHEFSIVVSVAHDGVGANYLRELKVGDKVDFIGPSGKFKLKEPTSTKIVLVATGTGIAPFISYLHFLDSIRYAGEITLLFGNKNIDEAFYQSELERFSNNLNLDVILCLSKQRHGDHFCGRVTNKIYAHIDPEAQYLVCGNPNMVEDVLEILDTEGIDSSNILFEKY